MSFLKKQIDYFELTLPEFWHEMAKGPEYDKGYLVKAWVYASTPQPDMGIWLNTDVKPLDNINVRLGIAHALNFDKVISTVLRGDYERLNTGYTGYGDYTNKEIKARPFDIAKAQEYFIKAGYEHRNGQGILVHSRTQAPLSFTLTYGVPTHTDRLLILKEDALKAGLDLKLKLMEGGMAFKSLIQKQFELGHTAWGPRSFPDFWGKYHSENAHKPQTNNIANVDNKQLDQLIDSFQKEYDEKKLQLLSRQIQLRVHDLAVNIPSWLAPFFRETYWRWWQFPKPMATRDAQTLFNPFGTGGIFWLDSKIYEETIAAMKVGKGFPPQIIKSEEYRD
jgi:microcin C transport system substrate-binding protein